MCDKTVNTYASTIKFVLGYFMTQGMCCKAVKTQRMCDEVVDDSLAALRLITDWFVTSKMIKELYTALNADENILYCNEDSANVVFSCNEMGILNPVSTTGYWCP